MVILVSLLISILVAIVLGIDSENNNNQAEELIPIKIPVQEEPLYRKNRNRS